MIGSEASLPTRALSTSNALPAHGLAVLWMAQVFPRWRTLATCPCGDRDGWRCLARLQRVPTRYSGPLSFRHSASPAQLRLRPPLPLPGVPRLAYLPCGPSVGGADVLLAFPSRGALGGEEGHSLLAALRAASSEEAGFDEDLPDTHHQPHPSPP